MSIYGKPGSGLQPREAHEPEQSNPEKKYHQYFFERLKALNLGLEERMTQPVGSVVGRTAYRSLDLADRSTIVTPKLLAAG